MAVNRIYGARAVRSVGETVGPLGTGYTKPDYRNTTSAILLEIETGPEAIIDRLLGRLARSLGATDLYPTLFTA